jgi:tetratricopeptide (TPR) repeat protein
MFQLRKYLLIVALILSGRTFSQEVEIICKGDRYYEQNQFESAIKYYSDDSRSKSKKVAQHAALRIADCYRILGEFEKAESAYKKILKKRKNHAESYLNYGLSLKNSAKFEEAKLQFSEYVKLAPKDPMGKIYLMSCDSAQVWLDLTLGKEANNLEKLNTEESDFGPFELKDQLYFCSSRKGSKTNLISFDGGNDITRLDIYSMSLDQLAKEESNKKDVINFKEINSAMHEGPLCFTKDGKELYFTCNVKGKRKDDEGSVTNLLKIFYTKQDSSGNWTKPTCELGFNFEKFSTAHPAITSKGNMIYFMSDKPGGCGKTDIYYSIKGTDGSWCKPINLGREVNTFGHELFPSLKDDSTLYFSSNAHPGMGQLDIFFVQKVNGKWSNAVNLKPPVNSIGNDFGITFDGNTNRGFFSSDRFNGKGSEDIYSFSNDEFETINISNDLVTLPQTKMYDNVTLKVMNITDSMDVQLDETARNLTFLVKRNKTYELIYKKNGFTMNKVGIISSFDDSEKAYTYELNTASRIVNIASPTSELIIMPSDQTRISIQKE